MSSPMKVLPHVTSTATGKVRNVLCALVGSAGLVFKNHYSGPGAPLVRNYGGNLSASFAVYFVLLQLPIPNAFKKPLAAGLALCVVELFEITDGFGVMANTYDPFDLGANALGVAIAFALDLLLSSFHVPAAKNI